MSIALIGSAVLTLLTAFAWNYPALPAMTLLEGFLLSGVSAVAPAYFGEELGPAIIGVSISLYLSGNHIGGMPGRVTGTLIEGWSDWRTAACAVGTAALIISTVFARKTPRSRNFLPRRIHMSVKLKRMGGLLTRFSCLGLYLTAARIMGAFVSAYNYISVLLEAPPFSLPHYAVAMIFLMYLTGVAGSLFTGRLSDRYRAVTLLKCSVALMFAGVLLLTVMKLWALITSLGIMTFAFFSAHTMASRLVSVQAERAKSSGVCLYWLFYYARSSMLGSATGTILAAHGRTFFLGTIAATMAAAYLFARSATKPRRSVLRPAGRGA